jgi:cytochrome P450
VSEDQSVSLDGEYFQNPHLLYRRLRADASASPVMMWGGLRAWLITRYAEAKALLNDPRLSKDYSGARALLPPSAREWFAPILNGSMLMADPPDHTRLRKLVVRAFTARTVEKLRPQITSIADSLLDGVEDAATAGPVDMVASFAAPLPIRVIGELLGVPVAEGDRFRAAAGPLVTTLDPRKVATAEASLTNLLTAVLASKRRHPADDLLTALVQVTDNGDRLTEDELLRTAYLLIAAGYETTVNLLGNGILALLQNPSQLAHLRENPTDMPSAVEEFLRYESPVNVATTRFTTADVKVGDVTIPAHEFVMIALPSANRDDRQFGCPERLDVTRTPNAHLAFGHGIHYCVGAPLARLEAQIAFDRLLARFGCMHLPDDVQLQYRNSTLMRGLKSLPVLLGGAPSAGRGS